MKRKLTTSVVWMMFATLLITTPSLAQSQNPEALAENVRSELVSLPYYGVFDHLAFRLEGRTVILQGKVTRPSLKREAEAAALDVKGVEEVVNEVEVLPASPMDDQLRMALYRAVYGSPALQRYALGANPAIRIIVDQGNVTLEGIVTNKGDKANAEMQARSVGGTFQIKNNLRMEQ